MRLVASQETVNVRVKELGDKNDAHPGAAGPASVFASASCKCKRVEGCHLVLPGMMSSCYLRTWHHPHALERFSPAPSCKQGTLAAEWGVVNRV